MSVAPTPTSGEFKRRDAAWRNWISREKGAAFPAERDRYHLFVSYACPWAHRTLIVRSLKGLEDVISVTVVHPVWQRTRPDDPEDKHSGWIFGDPNGEPFTNSIGLGGPFPSNFPECEAEPFFGFRCIRDLYDYSKDTLGTYSVPVLWDKQLKTIVSNESSEIIRMLNAEFNAFAKNPDLDLYPVSHQREAIDAVNEWVYPTLNNGVYRCGFAKSQEAYNDAIEKLTASFDRVDSILRRQRFIAGSTLSEADIRLFVTLLRFDEVYTVYFKTNTRTVTNTPAILNYLREIYQIPGVADTINMKHIKIHYYSSHPNYNRWSIMPRGNNFEDKLKEPHNRDNETQYDQSGKKRKAS